MGVFKVWKEIRGEIRTYFLGSILQRDGKIGLLVEDY